ncbi:MAG: 6,7-dimethyl-8-ribityllumazine synthase [Pirellula sp.]|jgi:6,7-dimethyl-8-ribityllumazine synthase|nr:6,7-dimethyl-8-ribityllumazine synthase [Pirellula sp.]
MPQELSLPTQLFQSNREDCQVAIVVSTYNDHITGKLCDGAVRTLLSAGASDEQIVIVRVPGAWELPFGTQRIITNPKCQGVIALGAVIRGETSHDQHINRAVSMALMQLSLDYNKPVALGLLTVNSLEQAIQRAGGNMGNKGEESANALLECMKIARATN